MWRACMWVADPRPVIPMRRPRSWAGDVTSRRPAWTIIAMAWELKKVRRNLRSFPWAWATMTWVRVMVAKSAVRPTRAVAASLPPGKSTRVTCTPWRRSRSAKYPSPSAA